MIRRMLLRRLYPTGSIHSCRCLLSRSSTYSHISKRRLFIHPSKNRSQDGCSYFYECGKTKRMMSSLSNSSNSNDGDGDNAFTSYVNSKQLSSSSSSVFDSLPTIWGGSAVAISAMHSVGVPYWGTSILLAFSVRSALLPVVIRGARASADLAKVSPEVQFLISMYQRDQVKLKAMKATFQERVDHGKQTLTNLRGIYTRYDVHPVRVFLSPLMQLPFFVYFASDIRKTVNGLDVELAKSLETGGTLWFMDLTEPDPWFVLPSLAGVLLYANVEMAVGKQSLAGEASSKSNIAGILKDAFQSLACFIPVFASTQPAMVQLYLLTSFSFSIGQGFLLRNEMFRSFVRLPRLDAEPLEPKIAKSYIAQMKKQKEQQAAQANAGRGVIAAPDPDILGQGPANENLAQVKPPVGVIAPEATFDGVMFGPNRKTSLSPSSASSNLGDKVGSLRHIPDEIMDAANKGELKNFKASTPITIVEDDEKDAPTSIDPKKIFRKKRVRKNMSKKKR